MNIVLPPEFEGALSDQEAAVHLAVGLYAGQRATLGQAASVANQSQTEFLRELGRRRIAINYGVEELREDIAAVQELTNRSGGAK